MSVDLTFLADGHRVNIRTAAIIKHEGFILCDNEAGTEFSFLPGGRISRGENSAEALTREMREELGVEVKPKRPLIITESFFDGVQNERFHELAFYYVVPKPAALPFTPNEICHSHVENGAEYQFSWQEASLTKLRRVRLEPVALHQQFIDLPTEPVHVVINELD